jgi:hypothetical protein
MTSIEVREADRSVELLRALEVEVLFAEAKRRARIRRSRIAVILTFALVGLLVSAAAVVRPSNQTAALCPVACTETSALSSVENVMIGYRGLTLTTADGTRVSSIPYSADRTRFIRALSVVFGGEPAHDTVHRNWHWRGFELAGPAGYTMPVGARVRVSTTVASVNGVAIRSQFGDLVGDPYPEIAPVGRGPSDVTEQNRSSTGSEFIVTAICAGSISDLILTSSNAAFHSIVLTPNTGLGLSSHAARARAKVGSIAAPTSNWGC